MSKCRLVLPLMNESCILLRDIKALYRIIGTEESMAVASVGIIQLFFMVCHLYASIAYTKIVHANAALAPWFHHFVITESLDRSQGQQDPHPACLPD